MTKKTRYGKLWYSTCPQCDIPVDFTPQLNFKDRCCIHCGWNDSGTDSNTLLLRSGGPPVFGKSMVCGCPNVVAISHFGHHPTRTPPAQPGMTCTECGENYVVAEFKEDLS